MERHVLVSLPHPDDESFGAGGTISLFRKAGIPVTYACGTLGQMGRNMGKQVFANRETMPEIRKKELQEACRVMGIQDLRMLGFHDKMLEFEDVEYVADKIEEVLRDVKPSLVITFYPGHGVHQDHDAFGRATVIAVNRLPKESRPTIYAMAITKNRIEALGQPDIINDIEEVFDIKLAALHAHRSQTEAMLEEMDKKIQNNDEKTIHWLRFEKFWIYPTE